ncbi:MAG: hypothetical protein H0W64_05090 [Gammaproteobacteria bacterium]|nr:hypothetical protein [Gammaproteobacteria bacterium]
MILSTPYKNKISDAVDLILRDYLDDRPLMSRTQKGIEPRELIGLINTLHNFANPESNYVLELADQDLTNLYAITEVLKDPQNIYDLLFHTSVGPRLTEEDKNAIRQYLRRSLEEAAVRLTEQFQLTQWLAVREETAKTMQTWWNNQSFEEKERIIQIYQGLPAKEKTKLQESGAWFDIGPRHSGPNWVWYYLMLNATPSYSHFNYPTASCTYPCVGGSSKGNYYSSNSGYSSSISSGIRDGDGKNSAVIAAVLAIIVLVLSGLIGAAYATLKGYRSLRKIGDESMRSLFRLGSALVGGYGGMVAGAAAGAALGSIVPGIGTGLGVILGAMGGAGVGAGLATALAKYSSRGISYLMHRDEINPTNPSKYQLSMEQKNNLTENQIDVQVAERMIRAIHRTKHRMGWTNPLRQTASSEEKKELMQLLEMIKNHPEKLSKDLIRIGYLYYSPHIPVTSSISSSSTVYLIPQLGIGQAPYRNTETHSLEDQDKQSYIPLYPVINQEDTNASDNKISSTMRPGYSY